MMRIQLFLFAMAVSIVAGCTTSDVIMTGEARTETSPEAVKIYLRAPDKFESIGLVTATSNATPIRSSNKNRALAELRIKAAKLGANGVILTQSNASSSSGGTIIVPQGSNVGVISTGRGADVEIQGEAVWVEARLNE